MSTPSHSYTEQLVGCGYGHPLWRPESERHQGVEVGDVGFLSDGCFVRIFNALLPSTHPVNAGGVPEGFTCLNEGLESRVETVATRSISTPSVSSQLEVGDGVYVSSVPATSRFLWSGKRGAMVFLVDPGTQKTIAHTTIRNYIHTNYASWVALAAARGLDLSNEGIVFISGWMKTSRWALATFSKTDHEPVELHVTPQMTMGEIFTFPGAESTSMSVDQRWGPAEDRDAQSLERPQNQTLFIQYYKCKTRNITTPPISSSPSKQRVRSFFVKEPLYNDLPDPLDYALDYILQKSSAPTAILDGIIH
ncbi:hypothetical protein PHLGIDRAFT_119848 [Phlebiopsis gigantea 11061_1 CR5-6]|uniref:Uncharacterized protein n=1 Tax=Phlebiopsis gigantea (strain 11061_1 CR5-6) TaxID=745531 RepID=A0A0C3PHP2_PHLG1|nr:hypothetical protein PHLGIDRAFT_119848 [Phlebiopsis gigantea 11061_1 CR5-6]